MSASGGHILRVSLRFYRRRVGRSAWMPDWLNCPWNDAVKQRPFLRLPIIYVPFRGASVTASRIGPPLFSHPHPWITKPRDSRGRLDRVTPWSFPVRWTWKDNGYILEGITSIAIQRQSLDSDGFCNSQLTVKYLSSNVYTDIRDMISTSPEYGERNSY